METQSIPGVVMSTSRLTGIYRVAAMTAAFGIAATQRNRAAVGSGVMTDQTKLKHGGIGWCDFTSNPVQYRTADGRVVWACVKVSAGCTNCYAAKGADRFTHRRAGDWNAGTMARLKPFLDQKELRTLLTSKAISGKRVFIGDMTDIFGEWVPDALLDEIVVTALRRPDVTIQILTKRAERMAEYWLMLMRLSPRDRALRFQRSMLGNRGLTIAKSAEDRTFTSGVELPIKNLHLGFSAEDQTTFDARWRDMAPLAADGWTAFCSAEPLLGPIDMSEALGRLGLSQVIVGGESGAKARPCDVAWVRSIKEQCESAGVPVWVKQLGARCVDYGQGASCWIRFNDRAGKDMAEWPPDLRVRQHIAGVQ